MAGNHHDVNDQTKLPAAEHKHPGQDHNAAIQSDAYDYVPKIINYEHSRYQTHKHEQTTHSTGPKLTDLSIDVDHVHEHKNAPDGGTFAERKAYAAQPLEISNEHYREIVKKGVMHLQGDAGYVSNELRTAFDEAWQSDKTMHTGGKHVEDLIKYANANLSGSPFTLGRHGDNVVVYETNDGENGGKTTKSTFTLDHQPKVR